MAKQSGLGDRLFVGGYDLSGDIGAIGSVSGGPAAGDVTAIDKSAYERIGLLRDGRIEFSSFFNDATDRAHPRLSLLPTADVQVMYLRGVGIGSPGACLVGKQVNYDPTRGNDGSLTIAVEALANGFGLEWGRQLTPGKRTDSGATNGASLDAGAPSSFGLQAYLQVFAFAGTSATVKLQSSSDDGAGDAFADIASGTFTAVAGITTERIATPGNQAIERYLRVVTTGTFSNLVFAVVVVRNESAVAF